MGDRLALMAFGGPKEENLDVKTNNSLSTNNESRILNRAREIAFNMMAEQVNALCNSVHN